MAEETGHNRTEPATLRKREEARKQGTFAFSGDLNGALVLVAALLALLAFGPKLLDAQLTLMREWFAHVHDPRPLTVLLTESAPHMVLPVFWTALALMGLITLAALGAGVLQAGIHLNPEMLAAKWERVSPAAGFGRLFSLNGLAAALFGVLKLAVIGWAAYRTLSTVAEMAPSFWRMPLPQWLPMGVELVLKLGWGVAAPLLLLAGADYAFKRWKYEQDLLMSREELREEQRELEGDPQIKQRVRQIQRARAARRMMAAVPTATVVVANPTHVAVALRYEAGLTGAPIVVAKGEHKLAERIKAVAAANDVPIVEEPPLARALLRAAPLGREIPAEFYRAVAEILALLYRRRHNLPAMAPAGRLA